MQVAGNVYKVRDKEEQNSVLKSKRASGDITTVWEDMMPRQDPGPIKVSLDRKASWNGLGRD